MAFPADLTSLISVLHILLFLIILPTYLHTLLEPPRLLISEKPAVFYVISILENRNCTPLLKPACLFHLDIFPTYTSLHLLTPTRLLERSE